MLNLNKNKIFYYILFMLMASNFLPLVFNNLPPIIRSHHIWTFTWVLAIVFFYPKLFYNKNIVYMLCYGFLLFIALKMIFHYIDFWNFRLLVNEFYQIAIGLSVIIYFYKSKDYYHLAKLVKWTLYFLLITAVMTIVSSFIDPLLARKIVHLRQLSELEREAVLGIQKYGGGGYSTATAFMAVIPLMIYYLKNIGKSLFARWHILLFSAIIFIALIRMQFFANILLAFVFGLIAIFRIKNLKFSIFFWGFLIFATMSIPTNFYVHSLHSIAEFFDSQSSTQKKIKDLATLIDEGGDIYNPTTGIGLRANRYVQLSDSFVKSPLLGVFYNSDSNAHGYFTHYRYLGGGIKQVAGTHIHWMNKLTITGIIGFIIFLYIPYAHIRKRIKYFSDEYKYFFILASLSILCYGLLKSLSGREAWYTFFVIIPGMYYLPILKRKK